MEVASVEAIPLAYDLDEGAGYGSARGTATARTATLARLETRDGTVGWGEAFGPPRSLAAVIDEMLAGRVVGMDPFDVAGLHEALSTGAYHHASRGLVQTALSAVDIACWDLMGKDAGRPVADLLSGPSRESIAPYASTMYFYPDGRDVEPELRAAREEGFDAVKIKIGRSIADDEERVRLAREVLGDDALLMVDANGNYRADQAIRSARAIEPYDVGWYEEPVAPEDVEGYREVREAVDVPIAGGEALSGRFEYRRLLDARGVDVLQPDLCICGGLSEAQVIAGMATTTAVAVTPHNWMSGVGIAAGLHFAAAAPAYPHAANVPEPPRFEVDRADNALRDDLCREPIDLTGGSLDVPCDPGLGIEVDEATVDRYRVE